MWSHNRNSVNRHTPLRKSAIMTAKTIGVQRSDTQVVQQRPDAVASRQLQGGGIDDNFWARMYVDDTILVEALHSEQRCITASTSLITDHYITLGEPTTTEPAVVSQKKLTHWQTIQTVLGWEIDTNAMTISLPKEKIDKLVSLLQQWPESRKVATMHDVWVLLGSLYSATLAVRPGKYFLWRLIALSHAKDKAVINGDTIVHLGSAAQADLRLWRFLVTSKARSQGSLSTPIAVHIKRKAVRIWATDASFEAIGGVCHATHLWWRYDLTDEMKQRVIKDVNKGYTPLQQLNITS
jgi:hypothetical protein